VQIKIPCYQNQPIYQVLAQKIKELKALGLSNEEIATRLKINKKTVGKGLTC
jgi:orotate phosphoribosyltransferase-like protein